MKVYYSNMAKVKGLETVLPPACERIAVLESYYGLKKVEPPVFGNAYFLDSGAFSAFRKKEELLPEKYAAFVEAYAEQIDIYSNLDVIGDAEATLKNQLLLEEWGLLPLPCYHAGEPDSYLERYTKEYSYISLGGLVSMANNQEALNRWLETVWDKILAWKPSLKVHGFGIQSERIMEKFPWYSVDASSVHMQARYGGVYTPWGWMKINPGVNGKESAWMTMGESKLDEVRKWAADFHPTIDFEKARGRDADGILRRCAMSIAYFENVAARHAPTYTGKANKGRLVY